MALFKCFPGFLNLGLSERKPGCVKHFEDQLASAPVALEKSLSAGGMDTQIFQKL